MRGRPLRSSERPFPCGGRATLPIVVEANAELRTAGSLASQIKGSQSSVQRLLHEHGAILFRGFDVQTDADFEQIVIHHANARPMSTYFMSESGRELVPGTQGVLNTSSLYKTGGGFYFGGFHSENFYTTDVPALQAFWCKEPARLGGETALVQSADVYDELSPSLKTKLAEECVLVGSVPIKSVAGRYGVDAAQIEALCREVGLEVKDGDVLLFKPPVIQHPHTKRVALQVNLSGELPSFDASLRRLAAASYRGWRWTLHRTFWRNPALASVLPVLDSYPLLVETLRGLIKRKRASEDVTDVDGGNSRGRRLAERLTSTDIEELAHAVWKHTSLFTWQRGDVLVCDQLQLMHAGMPGRGGRRELHVMMCAPIRMDLPLASGLYAPPMEAAAESIGERMARLGAQG